MNIEFIRTDGSRRGIEFENVQSLSSDSLKELYSLVMGSDIDERHQKLQEWYQRVTANA